MIGGTAIAAIRPSRTRRIAQLRGHASSLAGVGITVEFGGIKAVNDVSITLQRGEILGLIGPNGAGKTTLVNVLTGVQRPTKGRLLLDGADVTGASSVRLARMGIARTFQGLGVFGRLTALENVQVGALVKGGSRRSVHGRALEALAAGGLTDKITLRGDELSYGDARRVALSRAMAMQPDFLLLDEPAAGLDEIETQELMRQTREARDVIGCGVLVVEHNMAMIMNVSDRIQVLDNGATLSTGTPAEVRRDAAVVAAYLGSSYRR